MSSLKGIGRFTIALNQPLGQGQYGQVYKACDNKDKSSMTNQEKTKEENEKYKQHIINEIETLKITNDNPYILSIVETQQTANNIYIFTEYCNQGSLKQYQEAYQNRQEMIPIQKCIIILTEIVKGFQSISQHKIIHRDIKADNILIHNGQIKIADFGFARFVDNTQIKQHYTKVGAPSNAAPEILWQEAYNESIDIFSLGVLMFELIFQNHPYANTEFMKKYQQQGIKSIPELGYFYKRLAQSGENSFNLEKYNNGRLKNYPLLQNLLAKMLELNSNYRIGWNEIFNHPLFKNEPNTELLKSKIATTTNNQEKSKYMEDYFLQERKVICDIRQNKTNNNQVKQQNPSPLSPVSPLDQMSNYKITENQRQAYFEQAEINTLKQKCFTKLFNYILFERNFGVFHFDVYSKLTMENQLEQIFGQQLYTQLQICIQKFGLQLLLRNPAYKEERFKSFWQKYLTNFDEKYQDLFIESFRHSEMFLSFRDGIQCDASIQWEIHYGLIKNLQVTFPDDKQDNFTKELIACQEISYPQLSNIVNKAISLLHFNLSKNILIIWRFLQVCLKPQKEFDLVNSIDFYTFYDKWNQFDENQLRKEIQDNN